MLLNNIGRILLNLKYQKGNKCICFDEFNDIKFIDSKNKKCFNRLETGGIFKNNFNKIVNQNRIYSTKQKNEYGSHKEHFKLAIDHLNNSRYEEAIGNLEICAKLNPKESKYFFSIGLAHQLLGIDNRSHEIAIEYFGRALILNPDSSEALFHLAVSYQELNQNKKALELFEKVLELNPEHSGAHNQLGWLYWKVSDIFPDDFFLGDTENCAKNSDQNLYHDQKIGKSIEAFRNALKYDSKNKDACHNLGSILIEKNTSESINEGIYHLQQCIAFDPLRVDSHQNLASAWESKDNLPAALAHYKTAISIIEDPIQSEMVKKRINISDLYNNFAICLLKSKDLISSTKYFAKALEYEPSRSDICLNLINNYTMKFEYESAFKTLERYLKANQRDDEMWIEMGLLCQEIQKVVDDMERVKSGSANFVVPKNQSKEKVNEIHSSNYNTNINDNSKHNFTNINDNSNYNTNLNDSNNIDGSNGADFSTSSQMIDTSRDYIELSQISFTRSFQINPQNKRIHKCLGTVSALKSNWAEAIAYFEKSIKINPQDAEIYTYLGAVFREQNLNNKAKEFFIKSTKINPYYAEAWENLASYYVEVEKNWNQCAEVLKKLVDLKPDSEEIKYHFAIALQNTGKNKESLEYFEMAARNSENWIVHHNYSIALTANNAPKEKINYHIKKVSQLNPEFFKNYVQAQETIEKEIEYNRKMAEAKDQQM